MKHNYPFNVSGFIAGDILKNKGADQSPHPFGKLRLFLARAVGLFSILFLLFTNITIAQNCPTSGTKNLSANDNTYFPGQTATVAAGTTSITLGAAGTGTNFGNTAIASGDIVLIIQMQGTRINSANSVSYGGGSTTYGAGFIAAGLNAGYMEFAVASNAVPLTGGVLNLAAGTTYSYTNSAYGTYGQYTYQVIRVSNYYNITLTGTITAPSWNGSVGGVVVLDAVNTLNMNGNTISAVSAGFRGGAGRSLNGASGYNKTDYVTPATAATNGSKGEGISGTPRYVSFNNTLVDNVVEGYPNGSYARGAPGNGGGGATDSDPISNDQNAGGGGGGNGGFGGGGGDGWYSRGTTGGKGGTSFGLVASPYTQYYSPSMLIMGGGGGAGTSNNATGTLPNGLSSSGAPGGGMVIISALTISGSGTINVSGGNADNSVLNDGSGGGGAGGSILIYANSGNSGITAIANGGIGGTNTPNPATQHGPGGGGGGGVIFSNNALNASSSVTAGIAGKSRGVINNTPPDSSFGATAGTNGILTQTFPSSQLPPNMQVCQISVLPISLLEFSATYVNATDVQVAWKVTQESNASYFAVERSTDGANFTGIGQVNAEQGTDPTTSYTFTDNLAGVDASIVFYRLRMVDLTGHYTYSKVVPVKLAATADNAISIFPNPATSYTVLKISSDNQSTAALRIVDNSGRQISSRSVSLNAGVNSIVLDQIGSLSKGLYFIQVTVNGTVYNQKLLKN